MTPKTLVDPETGDEYKIIFPCDESSWLIRKVKKPKIIDLSPLVGSDVICSFADSLDDLSKEMFLGRLSKTTFRYVDHKTAPWNHCRPLLNHPQVYMGGDWPIPTGYHVEWYDDENDQWVSVDHCQMKGSVYRVTGILPGYIEPWQEGE